ncbi:MAG: Iron-sulfur cluster repair protein ScdA [Acidobacteria bacterium]|nr:Iron-sulfur cluster repair protein ScdA [Acidobacteriota bacterium]
MSVNAMNTVRELAATSPGATRVFERVGIDYCCGGGLTLADACQTSGISVDDVVRSLEEAERAVQPGETNWMTESLAALSSHIVETHHVFTREELFRLERLLDKVCARHGENHPELIKLREPFLAMKQDLLPHMLKEEQVLFPYIERMERAVIGGRNIQPPFFVTVRNPVRMMMTEHDAVGDLLREMRSLTSDYALPPDACMSYQTLYQSLAAIEADLHQHIHLENNILFPRAIDMESKANPEWQAMADQHQCFGH